jgi:hypothetical protein
MEDGTDDRSEGAIAGSSCADMRASIRTSVNIVPRAQLCAPAKAARSRQLFSAATTIRSTAETTPTSRLTLSVPFIVFSSPKLDWTHQAIPTTGAERPERTSGLLILSSVTRTLGVQEQENNKNEARNNIYRLCAINSD